MDKAQYEYDQLTMIDGMDSELISHPEFQKQFMHKYNFLTDNGRMPAKISYDQFNKAVIIDVDKEFPNDTNGIYHGYSGFVRCSLGIEHQHDKSYLCVREKSGSIYQFPNQYEDDFTYTSELDVYEDNLHVGSIEYIGSQNVYKRYNKRALPNIMPDLEIGYAIQGSLPNKKINSNLHDWKITSKGRINGYPDGIIKETTENNMKRNGNPNEVINENTSRLVTVSKENPYSLDYIGAVIGIQEHGKSGYELPANSHFNTLDDAISYYAAYCSEFVPTNSGRSR